MIVELSFIIPVTIIMLSFHYRVYINVTLSFTARLLHTVLSYKALWGKGAGISFLEGVVDGFQHQNYFSNFPENNICF